MSGTVAEVMNGTIVGKSGDPIERLAPDLKAYLSERLSRLGDKRRPAALKAVREEMAKGGAELTAGWHKRIGAAIESTK